MLKLAQLDRLNEIHSKVAELEIVLQQSIDARDNISDADFFSPVFEEVNSRVHTTIDQINTLRHEVLEIIGF